MVNAVLVDDSREAQNLAFSGNVEYFNVTRRRCRKSRENVFDNYKQKFAGIKCHENSKIKFPREFKVANHCKRGKICLKIYLIEQKSCNLLP